MRAKLFAMVPTPEHPVRSGLRVLAGLPACGCQSLGSAGCPAFPAYWPVALGTLSGHGRGGGCVWR
jgi:hypothetical protein